MHELLKPEVYTFKAFYLKKSDLMTIRYKSIRYKSMAKNVATSIDHSPHLLSTFGLQLERAILFVA